MISNFVLLLVGLLFLIIGGEFLVKSAVSFARKLKVSPFLIGITVVSFGTSAPELKVSIQAALEKASGIAIGNVVGSNIANIGLVLGLTVLIKPINLENKKYVFSWWTMFFSSLLLTILLFIDHNISFLDGIIFTVCLLAFIIFSIVYLKNEDADEEIEKEKPLPITFFYFLIGCLGLYFGSEFFVNNAVVIAKYLGVSEFIIGITIIAFGTSLPELVTCIVAAVRNQNSISIGNLIGSNIFNILAVLGITALIEPLHLLKGSFWSITSLFVMLMFAVSMGIFLIGKKISRFKGFILLTCYTLYILFSLFI